jgi:hypothetical protein
VKTGSLDVITLEVAVYDRHERRNLIIDIDTGVLRDRC